CAVSLKRATGSMTIASVARLRVPMVMVYRRRLSSFESYGLTLFTKQVNQSFRLPTLNQLIRYGRKRLKTSRHNGSCGGSIPPMSRRYPPIAAMVILFGVAQDAMFYFKEIYYV